MFANVVKESWKRWNRFLKENSNQSKCLGKQARDERLYLKREDEGGGFKSMGDVYKETRLPVACWMSKSRNRWIQASWRRETLKLEKMLLWPKHKNVGMKFEDNTHDTTWWWADQTGVETDMQKSKNSTSREYQTDDNGKRPV